MNAAREVAMVTRIARGELTVLKRVMTLSAAEKDQSGRKKSSVTQTQSVNDEEKAKEEGWLPLPGDQVYVPRLNKNARVIGVDSVGNLTLQAGFLKVTATASEVRRQQL